MSKVIIEENQKGEPVKEHFFVQTRKIARQKMKNEQGNNKISKKWGLEQHIHGTRFWARD